jgi:iron complex outermembrane receptor protein
MQDRSTKAFRLRRGLFHQRSPFAGASASALAMILAVGGGAAHGQEAEPAPAAATPPASGVREDGMQQVVVTAQFRSQKSQDTPLALSALSAETMEARGQTSITDITASVPSVTMTPAGSGSGASATASIRGVGQHDSNFAFEPGVGMYIDDVYYGVMFGSIFDLTDLDRVEVLRGPQGILAGKNSIGGAIKLFSSKPDGNGGGYAEVSVGSYRRLDTRAAADFSIIPNKLFARVSTVSKHRRGFMERLDYACATGAAASPQRNGPSCKLGTEGGKDLAAGRFALRWLPRDGVENNLIFDAAEDNSEVQPTKLVKQGPWAGTNNYLTGPESYTNYATYTGHPGTPGAFTIPAVSTMGGWGVSNNLDVRLGAKLAFKSVTALRRSEGEFAHDLDASPADVLTAYSAVTHRQFSQEFRLSGATESGFLDWTVGTFYYDAEQTAGGRKDIPGGLAVGGGLAPGLTLTDFIDDDAIDSNSKSVFANLEFHPSKNLSISTGVRYTKESKNYLFTRRTDNLPFSLAYPGMPGDLRPLNGLRGAYSGSKADYRVALDYRWSPQVMTYAQASTGFKGGGINPRPFLAEQAQPFDPETLKAFEVGIKSDLLQRRLRVNLSAYFNKYEDMQLTSLACPAAPCARPMNAGNADVKGVELEVTAKPTRHFTIDASASAINFDYKYLSPAVATSGIKMGMIAAYTPKVKYSLGMQNVFILDDAGTLTPRIDWSHQSEMFTYPANSANNHIPGYGLLNARLSWRDLQGIWEVALSGTNLADKFYYLNKFDNANAPFFVVAGQPGRPREVALTIKRTF